MQQKMTVSKMPTNEELSRAFSRVAGSCGYAASGFRRLADALARLEREEPELMLELRVKE